MRSMSLNGSWQLRQDTEETIYQAVVPGGVHTDLLSAGSIPDPFVGDNELGVQWVAERNWQYSRSFTATHGLLGEDKVFLVCDGLDTLGEVFVNGTAAGRFENMFRQYRWDVKDLLKEGENNLRILFNSPVQYAKEHEEKYPLGSAQLWSISGGSYLRKAPSHFGWDWGPMLPPIGIWKDIRLEGYTDARLNNVHMRQRLENGKGILSAWIEIEQWKDYPLRAVMKITGPDGKCIEQGTDLQNGSGKVKIEVSDPQLWWPNGYGEQPLYAVEITLEAGGRVLDSRYYRIGFRTIELRQEPDAWGESFTFFVNGAPVFAKGADWIPADSFPTRISDATMEHLIRSAADTHMNMLRVWGGGFYEEERFYDLCDRYGILVWQDFVFACNKYPGDPAFFENVRVEAIENVRRLRHRTSLALWCGNNEMEQGWSEWGWDKKEDHAVQRLKIAYDRMFHHLLPDITAEEDPDRRYWPSSASSGIPFCEPNGQQRGDCHYWDVWHGRKPFTAYRTQFPRFMSEFGFQSLPPMETVKAYADEKDWNMTSYIMEHHQRSYKGNGLMLSQMTDTFRMPKNFPMLVYLSMVLQAEGIRYGVEHWRRHKERVSGILFWQLNDCWPVASWSSIDYFGRWKALQYMARRFYAPVLMSVEDHEETSRMDVWLTSDRMNVWQGQLSWKYAALDGTVLDSGQLDAELQANESKLVLSKSFPMSDAEKRSNIFITELQQNGVNISRSVMPFIATKHLNLIDPQLAVELSQQGSTAKISITSKSLARFVELKLEGADVIFSDNYFDLPAGEKVEVTCPVPEGWDPKRLSQALVVTSLYDSF